MMLDHTRGGEVEMNEWMDTSSYSNSLHTSPYIIFHQSHDQYGCCACEMTSLCNNYCLIQNFLVPVQQWSECYTSHNQIQHRDLQPLHIYRVAVYKVCGLCILFIHCYGIRRERHCFDRAKFI